MTALSAQKHKSFRDELVHHPIGPVQSGVLAMFLGVSEASVLVKLSQERHITCAQSRRIACSARVASRACLVFGA